MTGAVVVRQLRKAEQLEACPLCEHPECDVFVDATPADILSPTFVDFNLDMGERLDGDE